ncbi:MAG: phosphatase PAP2 family protein [Bacteroidota bacterium]
MIDTLISYDQQLFLFLNGMHTPFLDFVMFWLSDKLIWIPLYGWLLFHLIRENRTKAWLIVLSVTLLVTITDQVSVQLFKNVFLRLRPCHEPVLEGLVHILNGHCGGQYGFISSHACNTAGVAFFSGMMLRYKFPWLLPVLLGWSALISYSRIYLGVHYPGDVIVGMMVGAATGGLVYSFCRFTGKKIRPV